MSSIIFLTLFITGFAQAQESGESSSEKRDYSIQLNFYGGGALANPTSLNSLVTESLNPTLTTAVNEIKHSIVMAAELFFITRPRFGIGGRYTFSTSTTGKGEAAGGAEREYKVEVSDVSLISKYMFQPTMYVGASAGLAPTFKLLDRANTTTIEYSAINVPVFRGLLGFRTNFGALAMFFEMGYQVISTLALKSSNGSFLTLNGQNVGVDMSGPCGLVGLGIQF